MLEIHSCHDITDASIIQVGRTAIPHLRSMQNHMQKPYAKPCAHILRIWCGICNGFIKRLVVRPWRVSNNLVLDKLDSFLVLEMLL